MEFLNGFCVNWIMIILMLIVGWASKFVPLTFMKTKEFQQNALIIIIAIGYTLIFKVSLIVAITSYLLAIGFDAIVIQSVEKLIRKILKKK